MARPETQFNLATRAGDARNLTPIEGGLGIVGPPVEQSGAGAEQAAARVFRWLRGALGTLLVVAGLDKFLGLITPWTEYLATWIAVTTRVSPATLLLWIGLLEVGLGLGIFLKPRVFGYAAAVWFGCTSLNLLTGMRYVDIALRDLILLVSALAVARLARPLQARVRPEGAAGDTADRLVLPSGRNS